MGHGGTVTFFAYRGPQVDHGALGLPDEAALHMLRQRLLAHGCEVTEMVDHGLIGHTTSSAIP
jgi:hypothetical protein